MSHCYGAICQMRIDQVYVQETISVHESQANATMFVTYNSLN